MPIPPLAGSVWGICSYFCVIISYVFQNYLRVSRDFPLYQLLKGFRTPDKALLLEFFSSFFCFWTTASKVEMNTVGFAFAGGMIGTLQISAIELRLVSTMRLLAGTLCSCACCFCICLLAGILCSCSYCFRIAGFWACKSSVLARAIRHSPILWPSTLQNLHLSNGY